MTPDVRRSHLIALIALATVMTGTLVACVLSETPENDPRAERWHPDPRSAPFMYEPPAGWGQMAAFQPIIVPVEDRMPPIEYLEAGGLRFEHVGHFAGVKWEYDTEDQCAYCHTPAADTGLPGATINLDYCAGCHDSVERERDANLDTYLTAFEAALAAGTLASLQPQRDAEVIFAHAQHVDAEAYRNSLDYWDRENRPDVAWDEIDAPNLDCAPCHRNTEIRFLDDEGNVDGEGIPEPRVIAKKACVACHQSEGVFGVPPAASAALACAVCHTEHRFDRPTAPHAEADFAARHGLLAPRDWRSNSLGECGFCHEQQQCMDCHRSQAPVSHTDGLWLWGRGTEPAGHAAAAPQEYLMEGYLGSCEACHDRQECVDCHRETPPVTHGPSWTRDHGRNVRMGVQAPAVGRPCGLCHTPADCVDCHSANPPASHTQFFRVKTHGLEAEINRASCEACHLQAECESCHRTQAPPTHVGGWGAPQNQHCVSCHLNPLQNSCGTCHRAAPSHLLATVMPADFRHRQAPDLECRLCHYGRQIPPHIDNGDSCRSCHR